MLSIFKQGYGQSAQYPYHCITCICILCAIRITDCKLLIMIVAAASGSICLLFCPFTSTSKRSLLSHRYQQIILGLVCAKLRFCSHRILFLYSLPPFPSLLSGNNFLGNWWKLVKHIPLSCRKACQIKPWKTMENSELFLSHYRTLGFTQKWPQWSLPPPPMYSSQERIFCMIKEISSKYSSFMQKSITNRWKFELEHKENKHFFGAQILGVTQRCLLCQSWKVEDDW